MRVREFSFDIAAVDSSHFVPRYKLVSKHSATRHTRQRTVQVRPGNKKNDNLRSTREVEECQFSPTEEVINTISQIFLPTLFFQRSQPTFFCIPSSWRPPTLSLGCLFSIRIRALWHTLTQLQQQQVFSVYFSITPSRPAQCVYYMCVCVCQPLYSFIAMPLLPPD